MNALFTEYIIWYYIMVLKCLHKIYFKSMDIVNYLISLCVQR